MKPASKAVARHVAAEERRTLERAVVTMAAERDQAREERDRIAADLADVLRERDELLAEARDADTAAVARDILARLAAHRRARSDLKAARGYLFSAFDALQVGQIHRDLEVCIAHLDHNAAAIQEEILRLDPQDLEAR